MVGFVVLNSTRPGDWLCSVCILVQHVSGKLLMYEGRPESKDRFSYEEK